VFHGGAGHAKTAHAGKGLATGIRRNPQDCATAVLRHVPGEERSGVEPGGETQANGREKRVEWHFGQGLTLDIIPGDGIEHQGDRPMAADDFVEVLLKRQWIRGVDGHDLGVTSRSADFFRRQVQGFTPTGGEHDERAFTHKGACDFFADRTRRSIDDGRST